MILVDSSAWIEFLRDTGSPSCVEVDRLVAAATELDVPLLHADRDFDTIAAVTPLRAHYPPPEH